MTLKKNKFKLGFLQGRLSRQKKKIQQFPKNNWKNEYKFAKKLNFKIMEWTIDNYGFFQNPLINTEKHSIIKKLCKSNKIKINSVTADFFMEKPFWKQKNQLWYIKKISKLIEACGKLKIKFIVLPLVDNSSIKNKNIEKKVINKLSKLKKKLMINNVVCLFESDYSPKRLSKFIKGFNSKFYGINYDLGNSASLNYDVNEEFKLLGKYIKNVHLKDRVINGNSVRFGKGNANFYRLFSNLKKIRYNNALIFQSCRATRKGEDFKELKINMNFVNNLIKSIR